jgi:hypothetical protein
MELMTSLLSKYALYIRLALALAVIAGACWLTYTVTDSRWQSKYDKQQTVYAEASAKAEQAARDKEHEYQTSIAKVNTEASARTSAANTAALAANDSIARLLKRLNAVLTDASTATTGTGLRGKTPDQALNLLADVLGKSVERNRQLASFADQSWNAAQQCYDSYNATK